MTTGTVEPLWVREFGKAYRVPSSILRLVSDGVLQDESWHNNACPSFSASVPTFSDPAHSAVLTLWVEHPNAYQREMGETFPRFCINFEIDPDTSHSVTLLFQTDKASEAVKRCLWMLESYRKQTFHLTTDPKYSNQ
jgi:hypothetical protein